MRDYKERSVCAHVCIRGFIMALPQNIQISYYDNIWDKRNMIINEKLGPKI